MYCQRCGAEQKGKSRFCTACGMSLNSAKNKEKSWTPVEDITPEDEDFYRATVGKNATYYLPRFQKIADNPRALTWNWSAFFVSFLWLIYRRMWPSAILYFISLILATILSIILLPLGGGGLVWLLWLGFSLLIFPACANSTYYRHCSKIIDRAEKASTTAFGRLKYCEHKGGTSWLSILLFLPVFFCLSGILAAIALPAYQAYVVRTEMIERMAQSDIYRHNITQYYKKHRQWPSSLDEVSGLPEKSHKNIHIQLQENGILQLTFHNHHILENHSLKIIPEAQENGVLWRCRNIDIQALYLPPDCKP